MYIDEIIKFKSEAFKVYFSFVQKYFIICIGQADVSISKILCHRKLNTAGCLAYR